MRNDDIEFIQSEIDHLQDLFNLAEHFTPAAMAAEAKMKKLQFARTRISYALTHAITAAKALSAVSAQLLIVCKDRALERHYTDFLKNIEDLSAMSDHLSNPEEFLETNSKFEDDYHGAKVYLDTLIQPDETNDLDRSRFNAGGGGTDGGGGGPEAKGNSNSKMHRSHLPDIKFQQFSGNYDDWNQFSQMFLKLVSKEKLDAIDKLYYLNQSLTGEPQKLIKHLPVNNESFDNAWKLLDKTYNVRRHIVNSQFKLFFSIPRMKEENLAELKNMLRVCLECESALTALAIDTESVGLMMAYYCARQMDSETARQWETELKSHTNEPKLSELTEFLQMRCRLLSQFEQSRHRSHPSTKPNPNPNQNQNHNRQAKAFLAQSRAESQAKCCVCEQAGHRAHQCPKIIDVAVPDRIALVKEKRLCFNCLYPHNVRECKSVYTCSKCKRPHHSLLHLETTPSAPQPNPQPSTSQAFQFTGHLRESNETLLATACVPIYHTNGQRTIVRALIDQGSTSNFISEKVCQLASYPRQRISTTITSLNDTTTGKIKFLTDVTIGSLYDSNYKLSFDALIMPKITSVSALAKFNVHDWPHIEGLELADPKYNEPGDIDLLIGARAYSEIILNGLRKGEPNAPIAQLTKFGWVLSGACETRQNHTHISCNLAIESDSELSKNLQRFWALEEVKTKTFITNEDELCEKQFVEGVSRASDGKIVTRLPFKVSPNSANFLGSSYNQAYSRLIQNERRLSKDEKLYDMYRQVLNEYIDLKHMREATPEESADARAYFLPHHAVIKMSKSTSKVRVVFDASCKSSNGKSLNDQLLVGATIQDDLFSLVLRWRKYKIAFTGDIEKMYRQFWVHADDAKYQRILWRNKPSDPVKQYILLTVTFGTASAPFQAIRSLHHIAKQVEPTRPATAQAIKEKFYVDDFLSCADTVEEALTEQRDISQTLGEYGLNLTKWKSNSQTFQDHIPEQQQENVLKLADPACKALGILWQAQEDVFTFHLTLEDIKGPLTKRKVVSEVAKLFDPLGWLAPCIILAKIVIQTLWLEALDWDDELPADIQEYWLKLRKLLFQCDQIKIKRWVGMTKHSNQHSLSLHGFCDASEKAYAAVVYLRVEASDGSIDTHLLAAKSKVAPLQQVSLPRLELCGSVLLTKLINKIITAMNLENVPVHAYSDSTVVLGWLREHPIRWQTFVANRVAEIQEALPAGKWRHVVSQHNPADCASRGKFADELRTFDLWWHGPAFLRTPESEWPTKTTRAFSNEELPERRKTEKTHHIQVKEVNELLHEYSSLSKLLTFTAFALRWRNFRRTMQVDTVNATLTVTELDDALKWWLRMVQAECFPNEVERLKKNKELKASSSLLSLTPYLDGDQVLRIRGRLQHSNLPGNVKHPIILASTHRLTWLVIEEAHRRTLHGGCQLTLQHIRQRFWIMHGRRTVSSHIRRCVRCFQYRQENQQQLMGDLPKVRFNVTFPFQFTGVDFAGYFLVKQSTRRNAPYEKCYVCLFICMVTKAIHLELAKDLSTQAFLDCYRCFVARRGAPTRMYSDRGTNFIGASSEMPALLHNARSKQTQQVIRQCLSNRTEWHFNPARAPHFGGLWEAVKSMKHHLNRVLHTAKLTEHQFRVVITEVECCLNSRPLCKLNEDPDDVEVLTPGHLVMGRAPNTLPEPDYTEIPENRLEIYQQTKRMVQEFWKLWHMDYLQSLQHRSKWTKTHNNIAPGQIVLMKEDNTPPSSWVLAKVTKVTYGSDGLVRVAEVRSGVFPDYSFFIRPIHKLCLLPIVDNELQEISHALNAGENVDADVVVDQ